MQVSGLNLAAGLAVKVICHSDVTGTWRQQATLGGLIWPRWQTRYAFADWFRVVDGMNCVAGPWLSLGGSGAPSRRWSSGAGSRPSRGWRGWRTRTQGAYRAEGLYVLGGPDSS